MDIKELDKCFENALRNFDFLKVKNVMNYLNWTWVDNSRVPSIVEMVEKCTELYQTLLRERSNGYKVFSIGTGGFIVSYRKGVLDIDFVLENSHWEKEWKDGNNE